jgi:ABC-type multidrug transport system fused ATPase/permease subunit
MRSNLGVAEPALRLIDTLNQYECRVEKFEVSKNINLDFIPSVTLSHVSFFYPEKSTPAVNDFNLEILPGKFVALVGPSGGGKSTLVDLILGVLSPTSGEVRISSLTPHQAIKLSPGAIGFVPQRSVILNRSIRENIALGVPLSAISEEQVSRAIQIAELNSFVESLPQGLDTILQEQGANLSGGQRQRLGIARALYTNPKLIVFDEATSSLDVLTEREITNSLLSLKGEATIIVIAHRLSTVVNADVIYYIDNGFLVASGNFDNLQKLVPGFGQ